LRDFVRIPVVVWLCLLSLESLPEAAKDKGWKEKHGDVECTASNTVEGFEIFFVGLADC